MTRALSAITFATTVLTLAGCEQNVRNDADRRAYALIQQRQIEALGETHDAGIDRPESVARLEKTSVGDPYAYVPHPVTPELPDAFKVRREASADAATPPPEPEADPADEETMTAPAAEPPVDPATPGEASTAPASDAVAQQLPDNLNAPTPETADPDAPPTAQEDVVSQPGAASPVADPPTARPPYTRFEPAQPMPIPETVAYAMRHARDLQTAKEELYLAALDLSLERHLWTPQFEAAISAEFADYGQVRDFDRAMTTVSEVAMRQRLPLGGDVTARLLNTLMRDLGEHITSGESGQFILEANVPLFRGAGRVAQESRYAAERALIYAVRQYERFRRQFVVQVATTYFDLQQAQASIVNAEATREALWLNYQRALSFQQHNQMALFEVTRVESSFRAAESNVQDALEAYESAKDQFKILIGMPVAEPFDVVPQEEDPIGQSIERLLPQVTLDQAVDAARRHRLDLLTERDRIGDAQRGSIVARNNLLPDLNLSGSLALSTDPARKNSVSYNTERATWRGLVELRLDDRMTERNAYRESVVAQRRSERDYVEAEERVRAEVRRALRRIEQARANQEIQRISVRANIERYEGADALNKVGRATNQDLVDAQNELLDARNRFAAAQAQYRAAILEFRLATDTLRIDDDGQIIFEPIPPVGGGGAREEDGF
ncbi:MAG: hypothetical protein BroJett003_10820 [Planctomycetota bacterium]|nr:MAG: hypothetical protein BroJett003_10820 [Planctomycetota bacterium]